MLKITSGRVVTLAQFDGEKIHRWLERFEKTMRMNSIFDDSGKCGKALAAFADDIYRQVETAANAENLKDSKWVISWGWLKSWALQEFGPRDEEITAETLLEFATKVHAMNPCMDVKEYYSRFMTYYSRIDTISQPGPSKVALYFCKGLNPKEFDFMADILDSDMSGKFKDVLSLDVLQARVEVLALYRKRRFGLTRSAASIDDDDVEIDIEVFPEVDSSDEEEACEVSEHKLKSNAKPTGTKEKGKEKSDPTIDELAEQMKKLVMFLSANPSKSADDWRGSSAVKRLYKETQVPKIDAKPVAAPTAASDRPARIQQCFYCH